MTEDVRYWLEVRQAVYSVLAALFRGDIADGLRALKDTTLLQQFAEGFDNALVRDGAMQILAELDAHKDDPGYETLLAEDYNGLFAGPGHLSAPPWESVYLSKEKLLFGEAESSVRGSYRSFGLAADTSSEPADHITLELAFMARLCTLAIAEQLRFAEILSGQQAFLEEHLLRWVPAWADCITLNARTEFWRGLSAVTRGWLENDLTEVRGAAAGKSGLQE
jgi:TorA maturation chaperone TorD